MYISNSTVTRLGRRSALIPHEPTARDATARDAFEKRKVRKQSVGAPRADRYSSPTMFAGPEASDEATDHGGLKFGTL